MDQANFSHGLEELFPARPIDFKIDVDRDRPVMGSGDGDVPGVDIRLSLFHAGKLLRVNNRVSKQLSLSVVCPLLKLGDPLKVTCR